MALNGLSTLLFVPAALEVLAEKKKNNLYCILPLIVRLELSHNAIENKIYFALRYTSYYFQIGKRNELTGQKS